MAQEGKGKIICHYSDLAREIVDEKYVIFTATTDPESLEILECLRACGLEQFCYKHLDVVYTHEALEFLRNLDQTPTAELKSSVDGNHIEVTNEDIARIFGLQPGRRAPDEYRPSINEKEFLQTVLLLRPADKEHVTGVTKSKLRRKYRLLFKIVSKVILGITFNPDALTAAKQHVMTAIICCSHISIGRPSAKCTTAKVTSRRPS